MATKQASKLKKSKTTTTKTKASKSKKSSPKTKSIAKIKVTSENKCDLCTESLCCRYITHELDKPKKKKDFDYLLWQVSHENVSVFKDDDGWFLSVKESCVHIMTDGRCGIYEVRPEICRDHSNDCCEYDGPAEEDYDLYFDSYDSLNKYCQKKFKKWDQRFEKWNKKREKKNKKEAA